MMNIKVRYKLLFILCATIILGVIIKNAHSVARKRICDQVNIVLKECILNDYNKRVNKVFFTSANHLNNNKVKHTSIETQNGTVTYTFKDSIEIGVASRLTTQFVLAHINPLIPDSFHSVFKEKIALSSIAGKTGITYRFQKQCSYSNHDSISGLSATYRTPYMALDIARTASVQAWINYDFPTLFKYIPSLSFILVILWIIICIVCAHQFQLKDKIKELSEKRPKDRILKTEMKVKETRAKEIEKAKTKTEEASQPIPNGLYISPHRKLYINMIPVSIQPLTLEILELLIDAQNKGGYVSRKSIRDACWKEEKIEIANVRIDTQIKKIRRLLQDSGYEVDTIRGTGFCLRATLLP